MRSTSRAASSAVALVLALGLGACGSDGDGPSESTQPECPLLTADEVAALVDVDFGEGTVEDDSCDWQADDVRLSVQSVPAASWAETFPTALESIVSMGRFPELEEISDRFEDELPTLDDARACEYFAEFTEVLDPEAPDPRRTVTILTGEDVESSGNAQSCVDERVTTLLRTGPGLEDTEETRSLLETTLDAAAERAGG